MDKVINLKEKKMEEYKKGYRDGVKDCLYKQFGFELTYVNDMTKLLEKAIDTLVNEKFKK